MNYIFISGCARSGTSTLAHLIGSHSKIILGIERYGHRIEKNSFSLSPNLFEKDRFLRIESGDTFYDDFELMHSETPGIESKFDTYEYIGDKRPELYKVYDEVFREFPTACFFFIYRDIYDVCNSWNNRAEEMKDWPRDKNYLEAVAEWQESIVKTIDAIKRGHHKIYPVSYKKLFIDGCGAEVLFEKLGLEFEHAAKSKYEEILRVGRSLESTRVSSLSQNMREFIANNVNFELYHAIDSVSII